MKRYIFGGIGSLIYPFVLFAYTSGIQEYFVMGRESALMKFFDDVNITEGCGGSLAPYVKSVVTITATEDNQNVIYDHWEDGYELDPFDPQQASTEVYILNKGEYVVLNSDGSGVGVNDVVPTSPRGSEIRYDGGDRVFSVGGPVNVIHNVWPVDFSYIGGAVEMYSKTALSSGNYFTIPLGEDTTYSSFKYVVVEVQAFEDDTLITVNNGSETRTLTLDMGESYITNGYFNNSYYSTGPSAPIQVLNNTVVQSSKPVQVSWFTGGAECYQSRFFNVIPNVVYGNDYILPLKGFGLNADVELIIYNPNDTSILLTVWDKNNPSGVTSTVSGKSVISYFDIVGSFVPFNSSVRISGSLQFWVIALVDYGSTGFDWGFSLIPTVFLQSDVVVSWSPACDLSSSTDCAGLFSNHLWVTPSQNGTEFMVDFNGDGTWDEVDVDCDGIPDSAPYIYDVLDVMKICEPSPTDYDLTGTRITATAPFAISYGEDPDIADGGYEFELDLGYTVLPLEQAWVEPVLTADISVNPQSITQAGGVVDVEIVISSHDFSPVDGVDISSEFSDYLSYVTQSAVVTFPDGTTSQIEPSIQSSDGNTIISWDLNYILYSYESLTVSFELLVPASAPDDMYIIYGRGIGYYRGSYELNPQDEDYVSKDFLEVKKYSEVAKISYGDSFTFYVKVSNTSNNQTSTGTYLRDVIPVELEFTGSATPGYIYDPVSREIKWGPFTLYPGEVSWFTFEVRSLSQDIGSCILNVAESESVQVSGVKSNEVCVRVSGPVLTASKYQEFTSATAGEPVTYTIVVANIGDADAQRVLIVDAIPSYTGYLTGTIERDFGSGFVSLTDDPLDGDGGGYNHPSYPSSVTFFIPVFPAGTTWQFRFSVYVEPTAPSGVTVVNSAYLEGFGINRLYTNVVAFEVGDKDSDGDGITDRDENYYGCTDPYDADTDDDGVKDGVEVLWYEDTDNDGNINACDPDSDDDGIYDGTEMGITSPDPDTDTGAGYFVPDSDPSTTTNPVLADTDSGGVPDGEEDMNGNGRVDAGETDPNDPSDDDPDGDGLTNSVEEILGTDPYDADTDDDGLTDFLDGTVDSDGDGLINALDPDSDNDGLLDGTEEGVTLSTAHPDTDTSSPNFKADKDPSTTTSHFLADTDGGGATDGQEDVNKDGKLDERETDPLDPSDDDPDGDGLITVIEFVIGTDYNSPDSDGDSINDYIETDGGVSVDTDGDGVIDALDNDSDGDGIEDSEEGVDDPDGDGVANYRDTDSDNDGLMDGEEVRLYNTNPYSADTDNGGVDDGTEILKDETDPLNPKDDGNFIVGGGCGCSHLSASPDFGFLLLLPIFFVWRRWRR